MKKIDYEKELNPAQLKAVRSVEGAYLVIAGAGSGKTRTLVYRVAYLVEKGVNPADILLLTFTRKAAEEMLRRASLLLDERCQRVSGGTFHSFANSVLRKYAASALKISPNFTILDESDSEDTVNLIRTRLGLHKKDKRFPRKHALKEIISASINKSNTIEKAIEDDYPQFLEWSEEIKSLKKEYQQYKRANSLMDYDDLLVYLKDLLSEHEYVRLKLSNQYKYIMVDEYQDTNRLQAQISCLLSSAHKNIMVVGDDSQSIYSFRGASFKNIMEFPRIFRQAEIITLEENYRSTQPILNLTNSVISSAREKYEKILFTRRNRGNKPVFVDCRDENAQSAYVADKIISLCEEGIPLKDIAVLFRSGWHSNDLEVELSRRKIPFIKYGGQKFVEAAHIKDVISYLRITYNILDSVSWLRALLLMRGIGPKTAEKVLGQVLSGNNGFKLQDQNLLRHEDLKNFLELMNDSRHLRDKPGELIGSFLKYYQPLLRDKYDDFNKRLNDLDSLVRIAMRYDSLEKFLADMALEPPEKNILEGFSRGKDEQPMTLSTIHSAKGLEWHTVFVIYVAEGRLPSYLSIEDDEAVEEERRLFYVACTRAKDNLFLLKPHLDRSARTYFSEGSAVFTQPSRFIMEPEIINKFLQVESCCDRGIFPPGEEEPENAEYPQDEEFLQMMKEYFLDSGE